MNKRKKKKIKQEVRMNQIEQSVRALFGLDDETLLRELKKAEMELERMKAENPELEMQIQEETEVGFQELMKHINTKGIKPIYQKEYDKWMRKNR